MQQHPSFLFLRVSRIYGASALYDATGPGRQTLAACAAGAGCSRGSRCRTCAPRLPGSPPRFAQDPTSMALNPHAVTCDARPLFAHHPCPIHRAAQSNHGEMAAHPIRNRSLDPPGCCAPSLRQTPPRRCPRHARPPNPRHRWRRRRRRRRRPSPPPPPPPRRCRAASTFSRPPPRTTAASRGARRASPGARSRTASA